MRLMQRQHQLCLHHPWWRRQTTPACFVVAFVDFQDLKVLQIAQCAVLDLPPFVLPLPSPTPHFYLA